MENDENRVGKVEQYNTGDKNKLGKMTYETF